MLKTIILTLVIGVVLFELIEVKQWKKNEGKVFVNGELWQAVSEVPLVPGDRVVIQNVEGLTLKVNYWKDENGAV